MEAAKKAIPEPSLEILIAGLGYEQGSSFLTSFPCVLMELFVGHLASSYIFYIYFSFIPVFSFILYLCIFF